MNGRSHQSNRDLVRYLDRSIKTFFHEIRKYLRETKFKLERGLFAEAETPATESGRRLYRLEEV